MRKFIIGAVAAAALALGFSASNASADWVTRSSYRWDPCLGRYVVVAQRVWVPDVVVPAPVYSSPGVYYDYYRYRPWYYPGYYAPYHHHDRRHHHHW